ncbi:MAG: hypothetical protein ACI89L_000311 [Phycisphaerales bacterium]|jgi:hypothetical protein
MPSPRLTLGLICTACVALPGCHRSAATFEAEAALTPGAVYHGPSIATFRLPVSALTIGQISRELEAMVDVNHALAEIASLNGEPGQASQNQQASQLRSVDAAHTQRLSKMLDVIGWPTERVFGRDAAIGAFVIARHSTHDPDFQRRCLALMHDRLASGEIDPQRVAVLTDLVRIDEGLGQLYGTQIRLARNEHGTLVATEAAPIADPETLDDRRDLLGLDPWRHYCRKMADTADRARTPSLVRNR